MNNPVGTMKCRTENSEGIKTNTDLEYLVVLSFLFADNLMTVGYAFPKGITKPHSALQQPLL